MCNIFLLRVYYELFIDTLAVLDVKIIDFELKAPGCSSWKNFQFVSNRAALRLLDADAWIDRKICHNSGPSFKFQFGLW